MVGLKLGVIDGIAFGNTLGNWVGGEVGDCDGKALGVFDGT